MKKHDDLIHGIFNALVACFCLYAAYSCFIRESYVVFAVDAILSLLNAGFATYYFVECIKRRR